MGDRDEWQVIGEWKEANQTVRAVCVCVCTLSKYVPQAGWSGEGGLVPGRRSVNQLASQINNLPCTAKH